VGRDLADVTQLMLKYAPEPPFNSGEPTTASRAAVDTKWLALQPLLAGVYPSVDHREAAEFAWFSLKDVVEADVFWTTGDISNDFTDHFWRCRWIQWAADYSMLKGPS
jgi:hypothetical protein